MKLISITKGYKTYITVAVGIGLGIAQALGYHIPTYVDVITGFLGLGFHRLAIQNQSAQTTQDVQALLQAILNEIQAPDTEAKK